MQIRPEGRAHAFNPSTPENRGRSISEFEATLLLYRASFRTGSEAREIPSPKTRKKSEVIANVCNVSTK